MEDEFVRLQNVMIQNFEIFQNGVENFVTTNKILLNDLQNVETSTNENCSVLQAYRNYVSGLLGMILNTTDFVKDMMDKVKSTKCINSVEGIDECKTALETSSSSTSTLSDATVTGYKNGYSYIQKETSPPTELNNNKGLNPFESNNLPNDIYSMPPNSPFKRIDTTNYQRGSIISMATVTSVQLDELYFHICPTNTDDMVVLTKLYNAKDRKSYEYPPTAGVIFGMKVDEGILRAIRCLPVSSGKVFLLDFGDIVVGETNLKNIFHLTKKEKNIPAQAILCKLVDCPKEDNLLEKEEEDTINRNLLKKLLFNKANFRVIENSNGVLHLDVLPVAGVVDSTKEQQPASSNDKIADTSTISSSPHQNTSKIQLSSEDLEMLYEEPPSTSNALLAVTGYVPKDDKRICRFYDPKINGCFKGNNCRQLHVPLRADHITKDVVLANAYSEHRVSTSVTVQYQPNDSLIVQVSHIKNFEYFYGIILNNAGIIDEMSFSDIDIKPSDYLKKLPYAYDIVLAKFDKDGLWYRAEVIEVDDYNKTAKVFYMDYGNCQTVPLKNLARCTEHVARVPPQAQLFRIADISSLSDTEEGSDVELSGMSMISDLIVDQVVELKVVSHYEDLIVEFVEEPFSDIPNLLLGKHCVKSTKLLPV